MFSNFIGKLCISDHAMSAREEFMLLYSEFEKLKNKIGIKTETYDKLKVDFCIIREENAYEVPH